MKSVYFCKHCGSGLFILYRARCGQIGLVCSQCEFSVNKEEISEEMFEE